MSKICVGKKKDGKPCSYKAIAGDFCKIHSKVDQGKPCTVPMDALKPCVTITFGDVCENGPNMQKIGTEAPSGFSLQDLQQAQRYFQDRQCQTELHFLDDLLVDWKEPTTAIVAHESAFLLVIRQAADFLLNQTGKSAQQMLQEQLNLKWDTKAKMKGRVVNKLARHNLCYADQPQEADYAAGKGTVVPFADLPCLQEIRAKLPEVIGTKAQNLLAEGNLYYDVSKCYIGFHGDAERNLVIAIRLGESLPLYYQWYHRGQRIGAMFKVVLNHGDMYIMSSWAVGKKWKSSTLVTLRHAAGCDTCLG